MDTDEMFNKLIKLKKSIKMESSNSFTEATETDKYIDTDSESATETATEATETASNTSVSSVSESSVSYKPINGPKTYSQVSIPSEIIGGRLEISENNLPNIQNSIAQKPELKICKIDMDFD